MVKTRILLLGSSGKLGQAIIESNRFKELYSPEKEECDLTDAQSINRTLNKYSPTHIINCAALARRKLCESNPQSAISINIIGTSNLVKSLLEERYQKIRLVHISTDAVYKCGNGYYKEDDSTIPHCNYGWSKLAAECAVRLLSNYLIVRTRFYDPKRINFQDAAYDIYTSSLPIDKLVRVISKLLDKEYVGVLNVGSQRLSDFERYKKHNKSISSTTRFQIEKESSLKFCKDYSLSTEMLKSIIDASIDE